MKSAAIIFSGGGLRGVAQFGSLKAIEKYLSENNIEVKAVAGSSFGSITASLFALGYNADEMINIAKNIGFRIFNIKDINLFGSSVFKGKKLSLELDKLVGSKTFKDANCDLLINAVDLVSAHELLFSKKGLSSIKDNDLIIRKDFKISEAVLASTAVPAIFKPKKIGNFMLVDGALVSPIGLGLTDYSKYDYLFIVDVSMANISFVKKGSEPGRMDVLGQSISIVQRELYYYKLLNLLPNRKNVFLIKPGIKPVKDRSAKEMDELIKIGYEDAKNFLNV